MTPQSEPPSANYTNYEVWKGWSALFQYSDDDRDYYERETRHLRITDARVLEIGFGRGSFLQWAKDKGAHIVGFEINPALSQAAKDNGFEALDSFPPARTTEHGTFDTIVAFDVFEHLTISQLREHFTEVAYLLREGGQLLLRFPNGQSPFGLAAQYGDITHRTPLSDSVLRQLLIGADLHIVQYGRAKTAFSRSVIVSIVRLTRLAFREAIARVLNFVYASSVIWDPVVTITLVKKPAPDTLQSSS